MGRTRSGTHPSRVREAAEALLNRGLRPTVQRVRAMLGGGSPNLIAPILKDWRDTLTPEQQLRLPLSEIQNQRPELPLIISDLASELWKRAIVFATIECKGSPQALQLATINEESEQLRVHNRALANQVESLAGDNLTMRERVAQLEAMLRAAMERAVSSEDRCQIALKQLREAKQLMTNSRHRSLAVRQVAKAIRKSARGNSHKSFNAEPKRPRIKRLVTSRRLNRSGIRRGDPRHVR